MADNIYVRYGDCIAQNISVQLARGSMAEDYVCELVEATVTKERKLGGLTGLYCVSFLEAVSQRPRCGSF